MGSCASLHKTLDSDPKSHRWVSFKTANTVSIQTPMNDQEKINQHSTPQFLSQGNATAFQDQSDKDDLFFDSQVYLDSDCEDFFSINGDLTPSQGNTPIHQSSFIEEVQLDSNVYIDSSPESTKQISPRDAQKTLSEFLHENLLKVEQVNDSPNLSLSNSVSSRETPTSTKILKPNSGRLTRSVSCCLSSLPRSLSFGERKKGSTRTKKSTFQKLHEASCFKKPNI